MFPMEAPDRQDRVRPLPPEGETGADHRAPSMRALLPMAIGGLVLVGFIVIVGLGGGLDDGTDPGAVGPTSVTGPPLARTPEESTSTTTTTIPFPTTIVTREAPELREVLPEFTSGLNAVIERPDGSVAVARWRTDRRFPQFTNIGGRPGHTTIDASGVLVARVGQVFSSGLVGQAFPSGLGDGTNAAGLLSVGSVLLGTKPAFVTATSFEWHASQPGLLAVTGRLPTEESPGLYLIDVDPGGDVVATTRIVEIGAGWFIEPPRPSAIKAAADRWSVPTMPHAPSIRTSRPIVMSSDRVPSGHRDRAGRTSVGSANATAH